MSNHKDWENILTYLGGETVAGGKLKESTITHWKSPNIGADNSSGFSALPGGYRDGMGGFNYLGHYGVWWSAWSRGVHKVMLYYNGSGVNNSGDYLNGGFSVRCVKD